MYDGLKASLELEIVVKINDVLCEWTDYEATVVYK